jgi:type I restriction enzyme, R subunit
VVTDRLVLDRQLQETIYQLEHAHGVVERIDRDSSQLAAALAGEQARIIITTLQKFPFLLDKVGQLPARRYAVIIDEAHSSQTGEAATELRRVLGAAAREDGDLAPDAVEDALADVVAARGRQPNLSFFAFTATPKGKTLQLFGHLNPDTGKYEPSHLYSMRQAIEEGFIHDVLANYTTYETFWRIEKTITEDPAFETAKARRAIARFVTLHEHNLAQRAEIVVEQFRQRVAHKIGGRAKAMVVTSSRPHAVRFYRALRRYIDDQGYDLGVLVAFSGTVSDDGDDVTEAKLNQFPDTETAARFDTDAYRLLVVAEKFQTGFDQPKLYAMYVDKTLTGLAAVQTLSRLNRTHPDKDGTFVLDFVNDATLIAEAFEPYYGETVTLPVIPTSCTILTERCTRSASSTSSRRKPSPSCSWSRRPITGGCTACSTRRHRAVR